MEADGNDFHGKSEKHLLRKASDHDSADFFYPANDLTIISLAFSLTYSQTSVSIGLGSNTFYNIIQHNIETLLVI